MARKSSKPTTKKRSAKQKLKDRYAHAREDAQLAGLIPTLPEEALKSEVVDPASQGEQRTDSLDRMAITKGWAVPEQKKQAVIERLLEPFTQPTAFYTDDNGKTVDLTDRNLLKENARVLLAADKQQYERDHPEEAGKAKGGRGSTEVNVNVFNWTGILQEVKQDTLRNLEEAINAPLTASVPNALVEIEEKEIG